MRKLGNQLSFYVKDRVVKILILRMNVLFTLNKEMKAFIAYIAKTELGGFI